MSPMQYGWIAGAFLFVLALAVNPWLCIPFALIGPGYAALIVAVDDEKGGRLGYPAHRWWFRRLNFADVQYDQISVMFSMLCFVFGVIANSWLSIPFGIIGLLLGLLLGGIYSGIRGLIRKI